jgi:hypothetical protein
MKEQAYMKMVERLRGELRSAEYGRDLAVAKVDLTARPIVMTEDEKTRHDYYQGQADAYEEALRIIWGDF